MTTTITVTDATPAARTMIAGYALEAIDAYLNKLDAAEMEDATEAEQADYAAIFDRELARTIE